MIPSYALHVEFFIPDLKDQPEAAEARWKKYLTQSPAPATSKRVCSLTYWHDGTKYVATVGEERMGYSPERGPRGGYVKNAPLQKVGFRSGTMISAIIDAGDLIYIWSYGPPFGGWANPALVGPSSVEEITYFD